jgi:hypothetical protein
MAMPPDATGPLPSPDCAACTVDRPSEPTTLHALEGAAPAVALWPIDAIRIGERTREVDDVETLAASIAAVGLLQPITVAPDGTLLAGQRRLAAARRLGWQHIPVIVLGESLGR